RWSCHRIWGMPRYKGKAGAAQCFRARKRDCRHEKPLAGTVRPERERAARWGGPSVFPSVARPVAAVGASDRSDEPAAGRASCACQEDCFPKGRSAGATLRLKPLDIGSPPFSSLNTAAELGLAGHLTTPLRIA